MNNAISCIYIIRNNITGERYIGQTTNYRRRVWQHRSAARKNHRLKISQAIAKYGLDNFEFSILEGCEPGQLNEKERHYIKLLKPEYNVCAGGLGPNGLHLNEQGKERSRKAAKKQWESLTPEQKQHIIDTQLIGPAKGHKVSAETREKLRKANLGKKQTAETIQKRAAKMRQALKGNKHGNKKVQCVETGETFESVKKAAEHVAISPTGISRVLRGRQKMAGGYKWVYQV